MSERAAQTVEPARLAALFARSHARLAPVAAPDPAWIAAEAHARGFAEGEAAAAAALQADHAVIAATVCALDAACRIDVAALRGVFAALATQLAEACIAAELHVAPELVATLADAALAAVAPACPVTLRVNPRDAGVLRASHPALALRIDDAMQPGSVQVEAAEFVIVDGLAERLAVIVAGLTPPASDA